METATPGVKSTADGWLNRYLQAREADERSAFRAVALTAQLPRVLQGSEPALAMRGLGAVRHPRQRCRASRSRPSTRRRPTGS